MRAPHDLRLVPAALAAWACAALALGPWWAVSSAASLAGLVIGGVLWHREGRTRLPQHQLLLCAAVALAVVLSARAQLGARLSGGFDAARSSGAEVVVAGTALEDARDLGPFSGSEAMVVLRLDTLTAAGVTRPTAARVTALGAVGGLHRGDAVRVTGGLVPLPDSSDTQALLVDATVNARASPRGPSFGALRARFLQACEPLGQQGRGLVPGLAIGDDSALPDTLVEAMRRTSLGHLTAVSGAHVALVLALVGLLGARAPVRLRAGVLLLAVAGLVGLVGSEASVVRAAAMGCTGIVALARGRPPRAVPALSTGVVALLVLDPWLAFSVGFALSVAATAALVLLAPLLGAAIGRLHRRIPRWLATALALPLAAHLACAPIIVLFTPSVSLSGVLANALAGPAVAPATVLGLAGVAVASFSLPAATVLARGAEAFTWWIATVATEVARLPHSAVPWPGGLPGALLLALVHALLALALVRAPRRWIVAALFLVGVAVVALGWRQDDWMVVQCDVGQGSALLVHSGPGAAVMLDVGPDDGRSQECLDRAGVTRLDLLVLSHPHADHVGNLAAVLASARVERVLVSPATEPAAAVEHVRAELSFAGLEPEVAAAGMSGTAGELTWEVLWPSPGTAVADANDLSVAVLVTAPGGRVLSLGDLQTAGQQGLAEAVARCGSRCMGLDVVAMAHHGSREQDPGLAGLLRPAIVLVSVGENPYGHPTREALDLYSRLGSALWRTDEAGALTLRLDGTRAVVVGGS